jgi:hypothetical protein
MDTKLRLLNFKQMTKPNSLKNHHRHHWHGHKAQINKLLSIITEGEGLPNYCRWKRSGRRGPGGGGGWWSRRRVPSMTVRPGERRSSRALRRGGARHRCGVGARHWSGGAHRGRGGGCAVEADAEEERASVGVWRGNDRVRVLGLGHT